MAAHTVWGFLFLLCYYYLLFLSAAAEGGKQEERGRCQCGKLGEISFPFTTSKNPKCGLQISDCDNDNVKTILLGNQSYKILSIHQDGKYNSIFICEARADEIHLKPPPQDWTFYLNNITSSLCSHSPTHEQYYLCQFPFIEIGVVLFESCEDCYHAGSQSQLNHTDFSCVHETFDCLPPDDGSKVPPLDARTKERHLAAAIIGLSIGLATVIILAICAIFFLYKRINKSSNVQDQLRSTCTGNYRNTTNLESEAIYFGIPVFSYEQLQEATNNFDQDRVLGEGGFGTVYYGKLRDGREVAVKRLFERNYKPVESFINEIQILTRMRHRNLVSLYGCTSRHSRELLLVYEFVPNGTVSCHLFGDKAKNGLLPWHVRMKIAIETACALAYLHASDIIHRDVKSSNILLDNNFGVKVADFGLSRLFPHDVTHVSTAPRGTPGYVDPDYRLCYQLTSKSDVYSFGVVLVELISSLPAVDMTRERNEIKLANLAIRKIQQRAFCELIDPSLGFQSDGKLKKMIVSVAELAFQCLQGDKDLRPSMDEVLEMLQRIQSGKDEPGNLEGIDVHGARVSQSYAHPSLPNTLMKPQRHHQTL